MRPAGDKRKHRRLELAVPVLFAIKSKSGTGITRTGVWVQRGIIAVDPSVIPLGSIVEVQAGPYSGFYTAMDTGEMIRGKAIDIYVPTTKEAVEYGRHKVHISIVRQGWNPGRSAGETLAENNRPTR